MSVVSIREELAAIAAEQQSYPSRRRDVLLRARAEHLTWREIAAILGMTEYGARKAASASHPADRSGSDKPQGFS